MRAVLVRTLDSNKQIRKATSLSGALLGWDEYLEFIQDTSFGATSLSEQRDIDEWFERKRFTEEQQ